MADENQKTRGLIVGLGNPVLRDDAVGVRLAGEFRRRWEGKVAPVLPRTTFPAVDPGGAAADASATVADPDVCPRSSIDLRFLEECSLGGLTLVEQLAGHDFVIALDSIRTKDGRPGDWCSFTASALRTTMNLANVHDANFATSLELGRRVGLALPPDERIVIFAVEIEDNLTFDERMSDALETAYAEYSEEIFAAIERLVRAWGQGIQPSHTSVV